MIAWIIETCVRNRVLIILLWLLVAAVGVHHMVNLPVDAIPDLSDVQVIISTDFPEQAPQVVEDQVTYPLTTALLAVPKAKVVRGYSLFALSLVYVIFEDGTDIYWARSRVLEYLNYVRGTLPPGVNPTLGPDATGVGWGFMYTLEDPTGKHDLAQLRSIQDWFIRYQLRAVQGVAEVASLGGFVKQYQVRVDPNKLAAYNIPLAKVKEAIQKSNQDTGGRLIEMAETEYMVRGLGYIKSIADVENIVVGTDGSGIPILIKTVAQVGLGPELRRGVSDINGQGEAASGIVIIRFGDNAKAVIERVKAKLEEIKPGLPPGVRIVTAYDRSDLINRAIDTLKEAIIQEIIIVGLICILFLLHVRSALVAIISLPLGVLISFILQYQFNITANILSLAGIAIAIGDMVDASMVMVEDAHKHLEHAPPGTNPLPIVLNAAKEVGPSLFFALLVLTVSFLPIFALEGESGRLFKPLAFTKTFAMAGASVLAITLIPILMVFLIRGRIIPETKNPLSRVTMAVYRPCLRVVLRIPKTCILIAVLLMAVTIYPFTRLGSEFMPALDEGDLLYMPTTMPGLSITKARELLQQTDRIISSFPEVEYVLGKAGRAETATDPAPLNMIETTIKLKPRERWRKVGAWWSSWAPEWLQPALRYFFPDTMTMESLIKELDAAVKFPGVANSWIGPIKTRIDMLSTGIKTPVGVKFLGENLDTLNRLAEEVEPILKSIPGTASVYSERTTGGYYLDFEIDRAAAARYGLNVQDVQEVILSALGGQTLTMTVEGLERYPVNLRYLQDYRENITALNRILIPAMNGAQIPMAHVAKIRIHQGPDMIKSEGARRTSWVYVDIRDIDVGAYIKKAKEAVAAHLKLPPGYTLVWSGQFEYMERAREKLQIIIPITAVLVILLIYLSTTSMAKVAIILLAVPFSLIGAIWLIWLLGYNFSVGVIVGLIALAGLDAETGAIMLLYLDLVHDERREKGLLRTDDDLKQAVMDGAVLRLRPKLMTVLANILGLMPVMWATGTGAEVAKRIAAPLFGGVTTSFLLELLIYPAVYLLWKRHSDK
jgi:Cu(I)/Ag(I) efflux system membrane protein CusA/SilA